MTMKSILKRDLRLVDILTRFLAKTFKRGGEMRRKRRKERGKGEKGGRRKIIREKHLSIYKKREEAKITEIRGWPVRDNNQVCYLAARLSCTQ